MENKNPSGGKVIASDRIKDFGQIVDQTINLSCNTGMHGIPDHGFAAGSDGGAGGVRRALSHAASSCP